MHRMGKPDTDELLTSAEAAALLRVSVPTANRMANDGRLPIAKKLPGTRGANLFLRSEVLKLAGQIREERLAAIPPEYVEGAAS